MSDSLHAMTTADTETSVRVVLPPGPMTAEQYGILPDLGYPTQMRVVPRDEELTLPEVLPDFRVPVREFFE